MKKSLPVLAAALALVIVGGGSYYFIIYRPGEDITTAEKAIEVITARVKNGNASLLSKLGADYLIAWAKALRKGNKTFIVNSKTYYTATGVAA